MILRWNIVRPALDRLNIQRIRWQAQVYIQGPDDCCGFSHNNARGVGNHRSRRNAERTLRIMFDEIANR